MEWSDDIDKEFCLEKYTRVPEGTIRFVMFWSIKLSYLSTYYLSFSPVGPM